MNIKKSITFAALLLTLLAALYMYQKENSQSFVMNKNDYEVKMFLGEARAAKGNEQRYADGEKHPVVVFFRQPKDSKPDFNGASRALENTGWRDVILSKAAEVDLENLNSVHPNGYASYKDAITFGFGAVVFSEPIE